MAPVRGALRYELELATSARSARARSSGRSEDEPRGDASTEAGTLLVGPQREDEEALGPASPRVHRRRPALAHRLALRPLRPRPRDHDATASPRWSKPFGFNVRWGDIPRDLDSKHPGISRWSPVEGATGYQVWFPAPGKTFMTTTNVARRTASSTPSTAPPSTSSFASASAPSGRSTARSSPACRLTTWGPWSPIYTIDNPAARPTGVVTRDVAVATTPRRTRRDRALARLTPGFAFGGDSGGRDSTAVAGRALPRLRRERQGLRQHRSSAADRRLAPRTSRARPARCSCRRLRTRLRRERILADAQGALELTADGRSRSRGDRAETSSPSTNGEAGTPSPAARRPTDDPASTPPPAIRAASDPEAPARQGRPLGHGWPNGALLLDRRPGRLRDGGSAARRAPPRPPRPAPAPSSHRRRPASRSASARPDRHGRRRQETLSDLDRSTRR